jgi:hypothetical protein
LKPVQANSSRDPISIKTQHKKRAGRVSQLAQCLPSKHEALSSNPSAAKKKKKKRKKPLGESTGLVLGDDFQFMPVDVKVPASFPLDMVYR